MKHLPAPAQRHIPLDPDTAISRHGRGLLNTLRKRREQDILLGRDIGPIRWSYLVDERIKPDIQKPHEDLLIRLQVACDGTSVASALPPSDFLPIEVVDALMGEMPRQRYAAELKLPQSDGSDETFLVVGGYRNARYKHDDFNLMVVKPGRRLPELDAVSQMVYHDDHAWISIGREDNFASKQYLETKPGEIFSPSGLPNIRWAKMTDGEIVELAMEIHGRIASQQMSPAALR